MFVFLKTYKQNSKRLSGRRLRFQFGTMHTIEFSEFWPFPHEQWIKPVLIEHSENKIIA